MAVTKLGPLLGFCLLGLFARATVGAVIPEDRSEVLYHQYNGGGITIDGPSILVRKGFKDKVSLWGNYYTDSISGASIDLLSQGSTYYEEFREEKSLGVDYLHDRTTLSLSATNSEEDDYSANSLSFSLSQDFFGDMSTLSLSYAQGNNEVRRNLYEDRVIVETEDVGTSRSQRFGLGLTQILTRKWIVALNAESVIDDGFLNNPYRSVRYIQDSGFGWQSELYPETRNSDAFAIKSMYYLPWKASLKLEYRVFSDSWGISANNYEIRYVHTYNDRLMLETKFRSYSQTAAEFYSDLFPFIDAQNFLARDKEMSEFSNSAFGLGATYKLKYDFLSWFDETTVNLYWDVLNFDYKNFREATPELTSEFGVGNEPLYSFQANAIRLFLSFKY